MTNESSNEMNWRMKSFLECESIYDRRSFNLKYQQLDQPQNDLRNYEDDDDRSPEVSQCPSSTFFKIQHDNSASGASCHDWWWWWFIHSQMDKQFIYRKSQLRHHGPFGRLEGDMGDAWMKSKLHSTPMSTFSSDSQFHGTVERIWKVGQLTCSVNEPTVWAHSYCNT